jgi:hypothetical protein
MTVNLWFSVGNGIGPRTDASVLATVSTIRRDDSSMIWWSKALRRMRML